MYLKEFAKLCREGLTLILIVYTYTLKSIVYPLLAAVRQAGLFSWRSRSPRKTSPRSISVVWYTILTHRLVQGQFWRLPVALYGILRTSTLFNIVTCERISSKGGVEPKIAARLSFLSHFSQAFTICGATKNEGHTRKSTKQARNGLSTHKIGIKLKSKSLSNR